MTYGNEQTANRLIDARAKNMAVTKAILQAKHEFENGIRPTDYSDDEPYQFAMQKAYDAERSFLYFKSKNKTDSFFHQMGLSEQFSEVMA